MASKEKFWMYDVTQLFRSYELLPSQEDSLSAKLNTITRLALIVCIVIAAYKPVLAFSTLLLVMVITMSVYSGAVADPTIEGFEQGPFSDESGSNQMYEFMREYNSTYNSHPDFNKVGFPPTQKRFCNDAVSLAYGTNHVSANQQLAGGANPKTRVPPLVAAPSHDLDSWRNNDFVVHSQINKETNFDAEKSGYNCGILPTRCEDCVVPDQPEVKVTLNEVTLNGSVVECFRDDFNFSTGGRRGLDSEQRRQIIRDLINDLRDNEPKKHKPYIRRHVRGVFLDRNLGAVNDVEIDEIIEEVAGKSDDNVCFESPRRDNILTQTLQPGVFQKSHIGEPIQSNIGISYTQAWGPTEVQETNDMIKYTMRDPKNTTITPQIKEKVIGQDHANVYDPRFTGYGTSYRSYTDQLTGRPKFFYDDVDAITMPNYVTRSKVDVFPWANTYGPDKMMSQCEGAEYRQLANNAFADSTLTFRTELQERLMRKRNAELWQRRAAPISTMGRLGSSMKSCL
jgi:hypothetical protein